MNEDGFNFAAYIASNVILFNRAVSLNAIHYRDINIELLIKVNFLLNLYRLQLLDVSDIDRPY